MRTTLKIILQCLMIFQLCACRTNQITPSVTATTLATRPAATEAGDYKIKPGDKLNIKNLNWISDLVPEPTSSTNTATSTEGLNLNVDVKGQIGLPEIGKLTVSGLTTQMISDTLSVLYKDIIRSPIFETRVTNLRVKVLGAVGTQGLVILEKDHQSLGDILARSGGIRFTEAGNTIQIIRGEGTSQRTIEYSFDSLATPLIMNQPVFDNDIVYVPPTHDVPRAARSQRAFAIVQPIFLLANLVILIINISR